MRVIDLFALGEPAVKLATVLKERDQDKRIGLSDLDIELWPS
jgi:hypothetical protein